MYSLFYISRLNYGIDRDAFDAMVLLFDRGGPYLVRIGDNFPVWTEISVLSCSEPIGLLDGANDALNLFTDETVYAFLSELKLSCKSTSSHYELARLEL